MERWNWNYSGVWMVDGRDGERPDVRLFLGQIVSILCSYFDGLDKRCCSVCLIYSFSVATSILCTSYKVQYLSLSAPRTNGGTDMENPNPGWGSARRDQMGAVIELTLLALLACLRTEYSPYSILSNLPFESIARILLSSSILHPLTYRRVS